MTGPEPPAVVLVCLAAPGAPAGPRAAWADRLAPRVLLRVASPGPWSPVPLGDLPYALLGAGPLAPVAHRLALRLAGAGRGPCHLLVLDCPPPPDPPPVGCPVTGLSDRAGADAMAGWRAATRAGFTLRVPDGPGRPPDGPVSADVALSLEEELAVWPY